MDPAGEVERLEKEAFRRQQLGEGWFATLADVPDEAISMTIRQIMRSRVIVLSVPERRKAEAVRDTLEGPVTPMVYVRDRTVWQYKLITRNLAKEEAPNEEELNALGKDGWELTGILTDHPIVRFYFKRLKD